MNIQADVIQPTIDANSQVVSDKEVVHGNGWTWEADVPQHVEYKCPKFAVIKRSKGRLGLKDINSRKVTPFGL